MKSHGRRSLDSGFTLACAEWDYPARETQRTPAHTQTHIYPTGVSANRAAISSTLANSLALLSDSYLLAFLFSISLFLCVWCPQTQSFTIAFSSLSVTHTHTFVELTQGLNVLDNIHRMTKNAVSADCNTFKDNLPTA